MAMTTTTSSESIPATADEVGEVVSAVGAVAPLDEVPESDRGGRTAKEGEIPWGEEEEDILPRGGTWAGNDDAAAVSDGPSAMARATAPVMDSVGRGNTGGGEATTMETDADEGAGHGEHWHIDVVVNDDATDNA
jgi:hypothetical protein